MGRPQLEHNQRVQCPYRGCSKRFQSMHYIQRHHMPAVHLGRRFECTLCGKQLLWLHSLREHMASAHGHGRAVQWRSQQSYRCDECDEVFKGQQYYKIHRESAHRPCHSCNYNPVSPLYRGQSLCYACGRHQQALIRAEDQVCDLVYQWLHSYVAIQFAYDKWGYGKPLIKCNRRIPRSNTTEACGYRPDIRLWWPSLSYQIIVEVDENAHVSYRRDWRCRRGWNEMTRMVELAAADQQMLRTDFVRFNPDGKTIGVNIDERCAALWHWLTDQLAQIRRRQLHRLHTAQYERRRAYVVYMFYPGGGKQHISPRLRLPLDGTPHSISTFLDHDDIQSNSRNQKPTRVVEAANN